ncbi:MAG: hypothetical protein U9P44_03550 [archaeon]|nr:hypothetical protein [archaeon]
MHKTPSWLTLTVTIICIITCTHNITATSLNIKIDTENYGILEYSEYQNTTIDRPFLLKQSWQNTGSIKCNVKARMDIFKNGELTDTRWSNEKYIEPGSSSELNIYYYPKDIAGNFTGRTRIYSCNDVFEQETINFFINNSIISTTTTTKNKTIKVTYAKSCRNQINMHLEAVKNTENILVYPKTAPPEWVIGAAMIDEIKSGTTKDLTINYSPSIWQENLISFEIIDLTTGNIIETFKVKIDKKEEEREQIIKNVTFIILGILLGLLLMPAISALKKTRHKLKNEEEKDIAGHIKHIIKKINSTREQFKRKHEKREQKISRKRPIEPKSI